MSSAGKPANWPRATLAVLSSAVTLAVLGCTGAVQPDARTVTVDFPASAASRCLSLDAAGRATIVGVLVINNSDEPVVVGPPQPVALPGSTNPVTAIGWQDLNVASHATQSVDLTVAVADASQTTGIGLRFTVVGTSGPAFSVATARDVTLLAHASDEACA